MRLPRKRCEGAIQLPYRWQAISEKSPVGAVSKKPAMGAHGKCGSW